MIRTSPASYPCPTPPVDVDGLLCSGQGGSGHNHLPPNGGHVGGGGGGGGGNGGSVGGVTGTSGLHHVSTEPRDYILNHCSPTDPTSVTAGQGIGGPNGRVLSRNANGTIAMTSQPTNESELQLYRVLQRANLLSYYDTFIGQGGDDVQQLCEAGEEEFLEIMALVGMASKPLHVRRLQKALQEWVNNPAMFQTPLVPQNIISVPSGPQPPPPPHSLAPMNPMGRPMNLAHQSHHNHHPPPPGPPQPQPSSQQPPPPTRPSPPMPNSVGAIPVNTMMSGQGTNNNNHNTINSGGGSNNSNNSQHQSHPIPTSPSPLTSAGTTTNPCHMSGKETAPSPNAIQQMQQSQASAILAQGSDPGSNADYSQPGSPLQLTPVLVESQIQRLSEAAEMLIKALPPFEPKPQNSKKKICKELEFVISMCDDDPRRMDEIRKYAAIYGRFDCKRKPEKPLTLHEVSVNEAAAQICRHIPALLTRRDELFPLARQVVRDSGYQYSKGHSRHYGMSYDGDPMVGGHGHGGKRSRLHDMHGGGGGVGSPDSSNGGGHKMSLSSHGHSELTRLKRQERLETLGDELRQLNLQQEELRARLTQARDSQDYPVAQQLQQQLEQLNAHQVQMMVEQNELVKRLRLSRYYSSKGNGRMSSCSDPDPERPDSDDTDSQYSFSNTSSPSQDVHDSSSQDYPTPPTTSSDLRIPPVQMQDIYPLKGTNNNNNNSNNGSSSSGKKGCVSGGSGNGVGTGSGGGNSSGTPHITKQMMQETLMDEGLRVVKELSSQIKEEPDNLVSSGVPSGLTLTMAMAMAAAAAAAAASSDGSIIPSSHHSHHMHSHHHSHHAHSHHHSHHGHHAHQHLVHHQTAGVTSAATTSSSAATSPVLGHVYGGRYVGVAPPQAHHSSNSNGPLRDIRDRDRESRHNGDNGQTDANSTIVDGGATPTTTSVTSSDVEKAAASTINALLSLSQNAGTGRSGSASGSLKQELPSPTKSND